MLDYSLKEKKLKLHSEIKHKGSSLIIAFFIMIILILLGTALMKVLSTSSESTAQEVIGTRAYLAANSAMQLELQKLFPLNDPNNLNGQCNSAPPAYDFSNIDGLSHCSAQTSCESYATHPITGQIFYRLTSIGKCASSALNVDSKALVVSSRKIQVEAKTM